MQPLAGPGIRSPGLQVPALGESITDGTIATLLKQPGDAVAEDEPILQIETDKVTIDVRAPQAGILEQFLVGGRWWAAKSGTWVVGGGAV